MNPLDYLGEEGCVDLKEGIDLQDLQDPKKGAFFEVDPKSVKEENTEDWTNDYFKAEDVYKNLLSINDESDDLCDKEGLNYFREMMKKMEDVTDGKDGGVFKKVIKSGVGPLVPTGALVRIHYNAYRDFDDEPFDSTRLRQEIHRFRLGLDGGVKGLHLAVSTMRKGERSYFIFKPEYYYGKMGCPPRIPADCTVLFDIELISFVEREGVDDYYQMTEDERRQATFEFICQVSKSERNEGNQLYNSGIHSRAMGKYKRATRVLEDYHLKNEQEEKEQKQLLKKVYLNIAACCIKLKENGHAITFCHKVMAIDPTDVKAHFRKGQALHSKGEFDKAKKFYRQALSICGTSSDITQALNKLEQDVKRFKFQDEDYKKICQRMFTLSGPSDTPETATQNKQQLDSDCSARFRNTVREKLEEFLKDADMIEMPFPEQSLTTPEIACILEIANELGMYVQRKGAGNASRMVVAKTKKMLFNDP